MSNLEGTFDRSPMRDRAHECLPALRQRAAETEKLRHLHPENFVLLQDAGLFKLLQPRYYGGYQIPLSQFLGVTAELATACPSSSWVVMINNGLMWVLSLFPKDGQDEVHGAGAPIVAGQLGPAGRARKVDGGYRVEGTFPFCSGFKHANWLMAGAPVLDDDGNFLDHRITIFPKSEATALDDWHTTGMAGTGSNSFVIKDLFVPEHRTLSGPAATQGKYAAAHLADQNLYRNAFVPNASWFLLGPMIGMAEGALEWFRNYVRGKPIRYTGYGDQAGAAVTHLQAGEAAMKIEAAKALAERATRAIFENAETGKLMDFADRARSRASAGQAALLCREAIDVIQAASGGSAIKESNAIQRFARDIQGASNHAVTLPSSVFEMYGRVLFGLDPETPMV